MKKILVVEDSSEAYALINLAIRDCGQVVWAKDIRSALQFIDQTVFDLVVLDLNLTDGDGVNLCSLLQTDDRYRNIPIMILSARQSVADQLVAFAVGADDYVKKPFHPDELKARVQSKLKKKDQKEAESFVIQVGDLRLDQGSRTVSAQTTEGREVFDLTSLEFKLLTFLCKNKNEILSRDRILDGVWGSDCHVYSRNIDTHISKIKKKLGPYSGYLQSRHRQGYLLAVPEADKFPAGEEMLKHVVETPTATLQRTVNDPHISATKVELPFNSTVSTIRNF